jgi:hypothetical protein
VSEKRCARCKETKPEGAFTTTDRYCKTCRKEVNVTQYGNRRRGERLEDAFVPKL